MEGIATSLAALAPTIDMCWAVILNPDSRDERSLSSVATLEEILRCATIDRPSFKPIPGPSLRPAGKGATLQVTICELLS